MGSLHISGCVALATYHEGPGNGSWLFRMGQTARLVDGGKPHWQPMYLPLLYPGSPLARPRTATIDLQWLIVVTSSQSTLATPAHAHGSDHCR
jgi:hypothetical protein